MEWVSDHSEFVTWAVIGLVVMTSTYALLAKYAPFALDVLGLSLVCGVVSLIALSQMYLYWEWSGRVSLLVWAVFLVLPIAVGASLAIWRRDVQRLDEGIMLAFVSLLTFVNAMLIDIGVQWNGGGVDQAMRQGMTIALALLVYSVLREVAFPSAADPEHSSDRVGFMDLWFVPGTASARSAMLNAAVLTGTAVYLYQLYPWVPTVLYVLFFQWVWLRTAQGLVRYFRSRWRARRMRFDEPELPVG